MKEWFERGGFLYDIAKEHVRLSNQINIEQFENDDLYKEPDDRFDPHQKDFLKNLNEVEKDYIKKKIVPHASNRNDKDFFSTVLVLKRGRRKADDTIPSKERCFKIQCFFADYRYKLPDNWDENRLLIYSFLWGVKPGFWPETEQVHYSISEIIENFPSYSDWEPSAKDEGSKQKWLLAKDETTLTTDIVQSANPSIFNPKDLGSKEKFGKDYLDANEECRLEMAKKFSVDENACFKVMYTIGNIMPAGASYKPGRGAPKDTFYDKLTVIKNAINHSEEKRDKKTTPEREQKETEIKNYEAAVLLLDRLGYYDMKDATTEQLWNKFIKDHYLQDFVKKANGNYTVPIYTKNPIDLTKGIIQRGYRIYYQYERDNKGEIKHEDGKPVINNDLFNEDLSFTCKAKNELQKAFKAVGIPDDNLTVI